MYFICKGVNFVEYFVNIGNGILIVNMQFVSVGMMQCGMEDGVVFGDVDVFIGIYCVMMFGDVYLCSQFEESVMNFVGKEVF